MIFCTSATVRASEPGTLKTLDAAVVAVAVVGEELFELVLEAALPSFLPQAQSTNRPLNARLRNGRNRDIISILLQRQPTAAWRRDTPQDASCWCRVTRNKGG